MLKRLQIPFFNHINHNFPRPDFVALIRQLDSELADRYGTLQAAYDEHNVIDPTETAMVRSIDNIAGGQKIFHIHLHLSGGWGK
ncbi:MAG: hypothetical protein GY857_04810 [Desulfobacula sp.]|nr:hypothetical protein [Desulfobacula sp.]